MEGLAVTPDIITYVMIHTFLDPEVQRYCLDKLRPEFFIGPGEQPFQLLWRTVLDYYREYQQFPKTADVQVLITSRLGQAHYYPEGILNPINRILDIVDEENGENLNRAYALDLAKLIVARYFKETLKENLIRSNGDDAAFSRLIEEHYQRFKSHTNYAALDVNPYVPRDLSELLDRGSSVPYNIPFIDAVMGGGCRTGEVYCLLGPTGGGKSLLALQLVTDQSYYFHINNLADINVFFTYELTRSETYIRAYAQLMDVPPQKIEAVAQQKLSFTEEEGRRYDLANHILQDHLWIVDFSMPDPKAGITRAGSLHDVVNYLQTLQERFRRPIRSVVLDWAGIIVEREITLKNQDISRLRSSELTSFVQRVKDMIAGPFSCSVWVVHQLSGDMTNKPPHMPMHHSNAQWCKSFANNATYAMCLGNIDPNHNVMTFNCSKARRSRREPVKLLKITDSLRFVEVTHLYTVDKLFGIQPVSRSGV